MAVDLSMGELVLGGQIAADLTGAPWCLGRESRATSPTAADDTSREGGCHIDRRVGGRRLAGKRAADPQEDLGKGLVHWQSLLHDGLLAMQRRGDLRADADLDELSMVLLTALQGGTLLG